jgi:hypothetical protein
MLVMALYVFGSKVEVSVWEHSGGGGGNKKRVGKLGLSGEK